MAWGDPLWGGETPSNLFDKIKIGGGVHTIVSNSGAFAVKLQNKTVLVWGSAHCGGNEDSGYLKHVVRNVDTIYSHKDGTAFAALTADREVLMWGGEKNGGSSTQKSSLKNVVSICATDKAFAALKADGTVVAWGNNDRGGDITEHRTRLINVVSISSPKMVSSLLLKTTARSCCGETRSG